MPANEEPHHTSTRTISEDYTVSYDYENQWMALLLTSGPRLNFSPETTHNLHIFLNEILPANKEKPLTL